MQKHKLYALTGKTYAGNRIYLDLHQGYILGLHPIRGFAAQFLTNNKPLLEFKKSQLLEAIQIDSANGTMPQTVNPSTVEIIEVDISFELSED